MFGGLKDLTNGLLSSDLGQSALGLGEQALNAELADKWGITQEQSAPSPTTPRAEPTNKPSDEPAADNALPSWVKPAAITAGAVMALGTVAMLANAATKGGR